MKEHNTVVEKFPPRQSERLQTKSSADASARMMKAFHEEDCEKSSSNLQQRYTEKQWLHGTVEIRVVLFTQQHEHYTHARTRTHAHRAWRQTVQNINCLFFFCESFTCLHRKYCTVLASFFFKKEILLPLYLANTGITKTAILTVRKKIWPWLSPSMFRILTKLFSLIEFSPSMILHTKKYTSAEKKIL